MEKIVALKGSIIAYLRDVRDELKHVVWPSRAEIIRHTAAVVVFSAVVALLLAGLDLGFNRGIEELLKIK